MSVSEFAEKVRKAAQDVLGPEYYVEAKENVKLNCVKKWSVNIHSKNRNITPVIYMDSFYADYEEGKTFGDIMNEVMQIYWEYVPEVDFDLNKILDYEYVKSRACIKLCNTEKNRCILKDAAHLEFNDLAILFYIELDEAPIGYGHIIIKNEFLDEWDIKMDELMRVAMENTLNKYPPKIKTMYEFFDAYFRNRIPYLDIAEQQEFNKKLYILTNSKSMFGATCMLYPKLIENFSDQLRSNLFIIPCSIHELILVPEEEMRDVENNNEDLVEYLKSMIAFVNDSELSESDFLSYNLYYFDRCQKNIVAV